MVRASAVFFPCTGELSLSNKSEVIKSSNKKKTHTKMNLMEKKRKYRIRREDKSKEIKHRDTKNIVKNIYRRFRRWTEDHYSAESELYRSLMSLFKIHKKYNNKLIIKLSKNSQIRQAFMIFCEGTAERLINSSTLKDKRSHLEAINIYKQVC